MASYIDSCTIITSGVALVIYQQTYGLTDIQFGALSAALTFCIAIGSICGGRLGDLLKKPYVVPFVALMIFYIGTNVPANSLGQFSTWIGSNVVELPISMVSTIGLIVYPIRAILDFVFMHFVDTPKRMPLFYMGAILYTAGFLMFPVFGASAVTYALKQLLYCIGAAFAFEGILKVWMQECFPTLLRTTANGTIVFVSRFSCAVVGFFTASFITTFGYQIAFWVLAAMCAIGFAAAIWAFHGKRYNTFETEAESEEMPAEA